MKAIFTNLENYAKNKIPAFSVAYDQSTLINWISQNGGATYLVINDFTQSPNSGSVSILTTTLDASGIDFPNYLIIFDSPLARPFGYFLDFNGVNPNLKSITFSTELDALFYPSITNAYFKCDVIKATNLTITPAKIDLEKQMIGDYFEKSPNIIETTLDNSLRTDSVLPRGWVVFVSTGNFSGNTSNGFHYFIMPYMLSVQVNFNDGLTPLYLMSFVQDANRAQGLLTDTELLGVYYLPHCPIVEAIAYTPSTNTFTITDSTKVELSRFNVGGGDMSCFKYKGLLNITSSPTNPITNTAYNNFLIGKVPGEITYAIGNESYSEPLHPLQIKGYPFSSSFTINAITTFSDKIEQYLFTTYSNQRLLTFPMVSPMFKNDSYLTYMKNQFGLTLASATSGIITSAIGAFRGDVSSLLGLGLSVSGGVMSILNEQERARQRQDKVIASNNVNILFDSMLRNEYKHYYGYRYNQSVSSYNRFSVANPDVLFSYNSAIEYVRFTEFVSIPLYTELERSLLNTRGIVIKQ